MEDNINLVTILILFFVIVGISSTVIYYFARYYFRTHENDTELAPDLKKTLEKEPSSSGQKTTLKVEDLPSIRGREPDESAKASTLLSPEKELTKESSPSLEIARAEFEAPDFVSSEVIPSELVPAQPLESLVEKAPRKTLQEALLNTKNGLIGKIKSAFSTGQTLGDDDLEYLEEILYTSDLGPMTVQRLVEAVGEKLSNDKKSNVEAVRSALKLEMNSIFTEISNGSDNSVLQLIDGHSKPAVIMVVGVNGAGKTTTIGKLAFHFAKKNLKTMVIAGDTFRAAAREQLQVWTDRADVEIFNPENVKDPSAVAFDGCTSAIAKKMDVVIMDTAGRLHTQDNLMAELQKVKRVMQKVIPDAPHETIIVLDANSGQNALLQAKMFNEVLELSGAVLTKLDGTAKGGVALGLAYELRLPIKLIGVGEGLEDLRPFDSKEFVNSIL